MLLSSLPICLSIAFAATAVRAQAPALVHAGRNGPLPADIESREWRISPPAEDQSQTWPHHGLVQRPEPYMTFENGKIGGSPGCGVFSGTYRRSGAQLTLSVQWADDQRSTCDPDVRKDIAQILSATAKVRRIHVQPEYWHDDALLLNDGKGVTVIDLTPMQTGKDLYEVRDTFWHLKKLEGSRAELSGAVVEIKERDITFSLPSYFISLPFEHKLAGLEFHPAWSWGGKIQGRKSIEDRQFERVLHKIASYERLQGDLAFLDKDRQPIMVLGSLPQTGIENRRWRIAKYRSDSAAQRDRDGLTLATERADITFVNGDVDGSPGCGGWVGSYKLFGDQLTVQASAALAGACHARESAQSDLIVKAFKGDLRIEQGDDRILLRNKSGDAQILLLPF
jgi:heat shock protein HslJ